MSSVTNRRPASLFSKKTLIPALGGAAAFWVASILTSLLPIARDYRAAYSNWSPQMVWVASLPIGLLLGFIVNISLVRWLEKSIVGEVVRKSVLLSSFAWVIALILIDLPMTLQESNSSAALYYFFLGGAFNAARFLSLGFAIGFLQQRISESASVQWAGRR